MKHREIHFAAVDRPGLWTGRTRLREAFPQSTPEYLLELAQAQVDRWIAVQDTRMAMAWVFGLSAAVISLDGNPARRMRLAARAVECVPRKLKGATVSWLYRLAAEFGKFLLRLDRAEMDGRRIFSTMSFARMRDCMNGVSYDERYVFIQLGLGVEPNRIARRGTSAFVQDDGLHNVSHRFGSMDEAIAQTFANICELRLQDRRYGWPVASTGGLGNQTVLSAIGYGGPSNAYAGLVLGNEMLHGRLLVNGDESIEPFPIVVERLVMSIRGGSSIDIGGVFDG